MNTGASYAAGHRKRKPERPKKQSMYYREVNSDEKSPCR